jgi:glycosyltransferase involved in cell wall biosynthesis
MRIAIDARLNAYRRGGIPEYTRQLLQAMALEEPRSSFISLQHRDMQRPLVQQPNVKRRALFTPPHHRLEQWALPAELLRDPPDLLHCPDFVVPLRRRFPAVATIHDLAFIHFPEILDDNARRYYAQVKDSAHSAEAVIAVSEATRKDMVNLLDLPAERIDLVYEAASPFFTRIDLAEDASETIGGHELHKDGFLLFVSTIEPRKNLPMLLQALKTCRERRPDLDYRLVVAGSKGWRYQPIFDAVEELGLADAVHFVGGVSNNELRWLYNACRVYANPSLYEGFGLPALEALACGAPSLISNTSSLPELVGESAVLLPPTNSEAWADALEALWNDPDRRADLCAKGPIQASSFSWQKAAYETLAIYRRVLGLPAVPPNVHEQAQPQASEPKAPAREEPITIQSLLEKKAAPQAQIAAEELQSKPVEEALESERTVAQVHSEPVAEELQALPPQPELAAQARQELADRACPRCQTQMQPAQLRPSFELLLDGQAPRSLHARHCPSCGLVELNALD